MPLLKCKEPGCPCQVDTALACSEVQSLFGMRVILEQHLQENNLISLFSNEELHTQLHTIDNKLSEIHKEDYENNFQLYKKNKLENIPQTTSLTELYIECAKGHRYYYDVQCQS